jgi:HAD superfamily hydrolase (TIGR01490 family)
LTLAIFDLDNTLLSGDSDHAWGEFLVERGLVDGERYKSENNRYYQAYQAGELDIADYLRFALRSLTEHDLAELQRWRQQFMHTRILPMIAPAARALVTRHRDQGHTLVIITSTNDFIAAPIAAEFGVPHLIASQAELRAGRYTGEVVGTPCYRHGKVQRLRAWMAEHGESLVDSWCYSDSHNDLPLLELVEHPVAVNPDGVLRERAESLGWPILSLH